MSKTIIYYNGHKIQRKRGMYITDTSHLTALKQDHGFRILYLNNNVSIWVDHLFLDQTGQQLGIAELLYFPVVILNEINYCRAKCRNLESVYEL